jgi:hypothetical protein
MAEHLPQHADGVGTGRLRQHLHPAQPDWSINSNPPLERLTWPTYAQVERHNDHPILCSPITPRESPPPGGMYAVREGTGYTP